MVQFFLRRKQTWMSMLLHVMVTIEPISFSILMKYVVQQFGAITHVNVSNCSRFYKFSNQMFSESKIKSPDVINHFQMKT